MKSVLLLLICITPFLTNAQEDTPDIETARDYVNHSSVLNIHLYKDGSEEYKFLDEHRVGDIVIDGPNIYNIVEFKVMPETLCSYIFIDGKTLTQKEIYKIQNKALKLYKKGTPFDELIRKYGMDDSPEVYEFKFIEDEAIPEFEKAVLDNNAKKIFIVNVPKEYKYFIVLKKPGNFTRKIVVAAYYHYSKSDRKF